MGALAQILADSEFIDLAVPLEEGMPQWRTHSTLRIDATARTVSRDGYFCQDVFLPEHAGCHVDAPAHVLGPDRGTTVDKLAADCVIGLAKKVSLSAVRLHEGEVLSLAQLKSVLAASGMVLTSGDIVLFDFDWSKYYDDDQGLHAAPQGWWAANTPGLDADVCRYLCELRVKAIGSDTVGVDIAQRDGQIVSSFGHKEWFLPHGIPLLEALIRLSDAPDVFTLLALPLKISGGSGSPVRAVAVVPRGNS